MFVTIVINVSLYSWWWVEKPTAVLTRLKKKRKGRGIQKRILIIGSADLLALSEKEIQATQRRKTEGPSVSRCSELSGRE